MANRTNWTATLAANLARAATAALASNRRVALALGSASLWGAL